MTFTSNEPRLLFPSLKSFYDFAIPASWPIIRIAVGVIMLIHGLGHLPAWLAHVTPGFEKWSVSFVTRGYLPNAELAYFLLFIETVGAACVALGLFTRFFAAALSIELLVMVIWEFGPHGFNWNNHGYEYGLMWGLVMFAIALRGGGPYSLDRKLGREL